MSDTPITAAEARLLFARLRDAPALVVAVSGGPDSVALLWLLARWRRSLTDGPYLVAATIDHGLRPEATTEARDVKRLAASLGVPHVTRRWTGAKPKTGLPAAAREARYALLGQVARQFKTRYVVIAHTQDDQAETLLMRLVRGSGLTGLKAMGPETARDAFTLLRPLLGVSKARLIATLTRAKIPAAVDPSNVDVSYARPRLRAAMPMLASEGFDAAQLARLAMRMQRADAALDAMTEQAWSAVTLAEPSGFDAKAFAAQPDEIRLRLLLQAIDRVGHEGPAELGKVESLLAAIDQAPRPARNGLRLRQTLAGATVTLTATRLTIGPAPTRRGTRKPPPA
jgi:tRNA(Ile)-lysidine synthase